MTNSELGSDPRSRQCDLLRLSAACANTTTALFRWRRSWRWGRGRTPRRQGLRGNLCRGLGRRGNGRPMCTTSRTSDRTRTSTCCPFRALIEQLRQVLRSIPKGPKDDTSPSCRPPGSWSRSTPSGRRYQPNEGQLRRKPRERYARTCARSGRPSSCWAARLGGEGPMSSYRMMDALAVSSTADFDTGRRYGKEAWRRAAKPSPTARTLAVQGLGRPLELYPLRSAATGGAAAGAGTFRILHGVRCVPSASSTARPNAGRLHDPSSLEWTSTLRVRFERHDEVRIDPPTPKWRGGARHPTLHDPGLLQ